MRALLVALESAAAEKATPGTFPDLSAVVKDAAYDAATMKSVHDLLAVEGSQAAEPTAVFLV